MIKVHPARSPDFLSRLHDGELTPGERAHFEAHRAHCAECRRAAAEFEAALSAFRTSATRPAPPDLSGRILRKLQAANRRGRPRLGVSFGIDLRWAGAFTAALVAVILGYAVVDREEGVRRIPVTLVTTAAAREEAPWAPDVKSRVPASARRSGRKLASPSPPAAGESRQRLEKREAERDADRQEVADRPARATDELRVALPAPAAAASDSGPAAESSERAGGEGAIRGAVAANQARPLRVTVLAVLDGHGAAPSLLDASGITLAAEERGQYVVVVDAQGSVESVERTGARRDEAKASKELPAENLKKLRFAAGDRPRRLLLRID